MWLKKAGFEPRPNTITTTSDSGAAKGSSSSQNAENSAVGHGGTGSQPTPANNVSGGRRSPTSPTSSTTSRRRVRSNHIEQSLFCVDHFPLAHTANTQQIPHAPTRYPPPANHHISTSESHIPFSTRATKVPRALLPSSLTHLPLQSSSSEMRFSGLHTLKRTSQDERRASFMEQRPGSGSSITAALDRVLRGVR